MSFKDYFLQQTAGKTAVVESATKFDDSVDATEFMQKIGDMISSPVLYNWAKSTDENFDTNTQSKLQKLNDAFSVFMEEMDKAV